MIHSRRTRPILIWTVAALMLGGCAGLFPTPAPTRTPLPTSTPTATTLWFPPTNTATSLPSTTPIPTVDSHPGLGDLLFADSFDRPELWNISDSLSASASVNRNRLTLSLNGPGPLSIRSLRSEPLVRDFYAEVSVDVALCRGPDQYGLVFRASPGENFYRYTISCQGQVRLERGRIGSVMPLMEWVTSGDAPMGSPARPRIGVWAVGSEMRLFIDGRLQFALRDPILHEGALGFFAYASGTTPVTISFSELAVHSVFYVSPTATLRLPSATASPSPLP
jgi:hypothetical protein